MIPVLFVRGKTLPEAWENSLLALWEQGTSLQTEYDKPGDPDSRDATMTIVVEDPLAEPRLHRAFPAGLEELEIYRQEVVLGVHDHWIDPAAGKWTYTYHKRLFDYQIDALPSVDQIHYMIEKLSETPHSRRAQAITWIPFSDPPTHDPPCLQRVWCRVTEDAGQQYLNMNISFRSNDAFKAAFMNMWALIDLQRMIAAGISERIGKPVRLGRYVHSADSYHIYGSYFDEFEGFLRSVRTRSFEERTWRGDDPMVQASFEDGQARLEREKQTGQIGVAIADSSY